MSTEIDNLKKRLANLGCSDNSCMVAPKSMRKVGTNGGCKCFSEIREPLNRVKIRTILFFYRDLVNELEGAK